MMVIIKKRMMVGVTDIVCVDDVDCCVDDVDCC